MRTAAALVLTLALALTGCSGDDEPTTAQDPAPGDPTSEPASPATPPAAPAASGPVRSRTTATVMDTGGGPELCLGPIMESYPPQCSGPEVVGWDWADQAEYAEQQGDVRWGTFAVTGTWDGTAFTLTEAVPAALHDPVPEAPVELPTPSVELSGAAREAIATEVTASWPGVQSAFPDEAGHVLVDVTYDDGSLQTYADAAYGEGVVVVTGALVDA